MATGVNKKLNVEYVGDASGLKKTAKEVEDAHTSMGNNLQNVVSQMLGHASKLASGMGLNLGTVGNIGQKLGGAFKDMQGEMGGLASEAGSLGGAIGGMAGPIGIGIGAAVGIAAELKHAADVTAEMAGEIRKLSAITGASAEDASRLRHEFAHYGVDVDAGGVALVKFSKNLQEGGAKFKGWFSEADLAQMKGKSLTQDLPILAAKYQSLGTAVEKNTFLLDAFGKGGTALRPILSANAQELARVAKEADKFGLTFSAKGLADAKAYSMAQRDMGEALKGVEVTIGRAVIPALTTFIGDLTKGIVVLKDINHWITEHTHGLTSLGTILGGPIAWAMKAYHTATGDNTAATQTHRQAVEADQAAMEENAQQAEAAAKAMQQWADKVEKSFNPLQAAITATEGLDRAQDQSVKNSQAIADAQQHLNELRNGGVINTNALQSAEKGLESAQIAAINAAKNLETSSDNVTKARQKEADATQALMDVMAGPSPLDLAKAQENIGKAHNNTTKSILALHSAEDNLIKTRKTAGATADQLTAAEVGVSDAQFAVTDATRAETDAQQALKDLQDSSLPTSKSYKSALDALAVAHENVQNAIDQQVASERALQDAQNNQADAADKLRQAQAPDPAMIKAIEQAQKSLTSALEAQQGTVKATTMSFTDFKGQMVQQIQDMSAWADNLQYLMDQRVSPAFLKTLADMGPKAGPELKMFRDEVAKHGVGAINDLVGALADPERRVASAAEQLGTSIQDAFGKNGPIVIPFTLSAVGTTTPYGPLPGGGNINQHAHLAEGGVITKPTFALIGEGREPEAVAPLSELQKMIDMGGGGGSSNITVHTHIMLDGRQIAENVTQHQAAYSRRNVTVGGGQVRY